MFELEQAIDDWKRTFRPDSSIEADGILEVESHLRESIERLQGTGLSEREAFAVGAYRLGITADLESEFGKNKPVSAWRTRLAWMLGGFLLFTLCGSGVSALVAMTGAWMAYAGVEATMAGPISIAVLTVAWAGLLAIAYRGLVNRDPTNNRFTWRWAAVTGLALYVLPTATVMGRLAQQRIADAAWYGDTATWLGFGGFFFHFGGYLFCLVALCKLSKPSVPVVVRRFSKSCQP
ncbi:hypothetical protein [Novipirellula artificiosorum]|uniref:Uncharacterized protein n=1 Tax=Novipirellula artificiosorum TaxID=2528016 RepID=A0A5C6DD70_9BACT|nr:hypothetical protein [Novipirellula artificiosorum]TWU34195.1 hypothetical protein Poly41_43410 [Novipirellula artificiosorum]